MTESAHLAAIIEKRESAANLMVVFADIVSYSRRRTVNQKAVIDVFTKILTDALNAQAAKNVEYCQKNGLNFSTDIIKIPTGDGAALGFSFDGLHEIHLNFALDLLERVHEHNVANPCEIYSAAGWCNCHANFELRIGISTGKTVIFRDINGNYNAAGNAMNLAARVMGQVDAGQIALSAEAYENLIDMAEDPQMAQKFVVFENIRIKHNLLLDIYQYVSPDSAFVNVNTPSRFAQWAAIQESGKLLTTLHPGFQLSNVTDMDPTKLPAMMKEFASAVEAIQAAEAQQNATMSRIFGGLGAGGPAVVEGAIIDGEDHPDSGG